MAKQIQVEITSAVVVDGKIARPGTQVQLDEVDAKNLIQRKKAKLAIAKAGEDEGGEPTLGKMTVPELKEIAEELEVEGFENMNKAKLIAAIEEAEAENE
jgi:hypothetical protein